MKDVLGDGDVGCVELSSTALQGPCTYGCRFRLVPSILLGCLIPWEPGAAVPSLLDLSSYSGAGWSIPQDSFDPLLAACLMALGKGPRVAAAMLTLPLAGRSRVLDALGSLPARSGSSSSSDERSLR